MKLLLYSHFFAPSVGGVESLVLSLSRGLTEECRSAGIREFDITLVTQTATNGYDDSSLPFPVVRQPSTFQLLKLIHSSDIVHVAGASFFPVLIAWLWGKPLVIEHHGFQAVCPTGQLLIEPGGVPCPGYFAAGKHRECLRCRSDDNWLASFKLWAGTFVRRYLCNRAASNVVPTAWLGELLGLPNTVPIPHGVEVGNLRSNSLRQAKPSRIVFQGRLVSTKGLTVLLEAASILRLEGRVFEILVIGDGPERARMQELTEKMQLKSYVHFTGSIATTDLDLIFATANVVVVPSLGGEVFGLVLAETMSRGLPVVASDLGSFTEVLGNTGLTFEVGNAKSLAEKIARVLDDPELASALAGRARQRISEYYLRSQMIKRHAELYQRLHSAEKS